MTANNDSMSRPRDIKQIRNVSRTVAASTAQTKTGNAADELQVLIGSVHDQDFVKEIVVRHGKSPVIIAFTDDQIADLRRFSSASTPSHLRAVVGVDRTFNLGPCYVTLTVFKHMGLLQKESRDNPLIHRTDHVSLRW